MGDLVGILVIAEFYYVLVVIVTSGRYTFVHPNSTNPCIIANSTTTTKQSLPIKSEESVKIGKHQPMSRPRSTLADVTSALADTTGGCGVQVYATDGLLMATPPPPGHRRTGPSSPDSRRLLEVLVRNSRNPLSTFTS